MSLSRILRYNQRNNKSTASLTAEHAYSDNWAYSVSLGDPTSVGVNMAAKTGEALNKSYDSVFLLSLLQIVYLGQTLLHLPGMMKTRTCKS